MTENGDVCEAGSTEHECELEDEAPVDFETAPLIEEEDNSCKKMKKMKEDEEDEMKKVETCRCRGRG